MRMNKTVIATIVASAISMPAMANNLNLGNVNGPYMDGRCASVAAGGDCHANTTIENVEGDLVLDGVEVDLDSLKGADGQDGADGRDGVDGKSAVVTDDGNGNITIGVEGDTEQVNLNDTFATDEDVADVNARVDNANTRITNANNARAEGDRRVALAAKNYTDQEVGKVSDRVADVDKLAQTNKQAIEKEAQLRDEADQALGDAINETNKVLGQTADLAVSNSKVLETTNAKLAQTTDLAVQNANTLDTAVEDISNIKDDVAHNAAEIGRVEAKADVAQDTANKARQEAAQVASDLEVTNKNVDANKQAIAQEEAARIAGDEKVAQESLDRDVELQGNIQAVSDYAEAEITTLYMTKLDKETFGNYVVSQQRIDASQNRRLGALEKWKKQADYRMDGLDARISGTQAMLSAGQNATPDLVTGQTFGLGVGVGFASDNAKSIAGGAKYRINEHVGLSATINYGQYDVGSETERDLTAGAGVQIAW